MNSTNSSAYPLFIRFFNNGEPVIDAAASSHWQAFAKKFDVRLHDGQIVLASGYGFGTCGSVGFGNIFDLFANKFHLLNLRIPTLKDDVLKAQLIVKRMGLRFSQDAFRQVCTLNLIVRTFGASAPANILVIGDGYGILSALLHDRYPDAKIFLADLGSVLFFQAYYLSKAFPEAKQTIADEHDEANESVRAVFSFCPADNLDSLANEEFDIAINVASMQEMTPAVINDYFHFLRQQNTKLFYCCNRLEKKLIGGEVTRFMDYPWSPNDEYIVDELCPWHQWFLGMGLSKTVKIFGVPAPFIHRYDGLHWHRLAILNK